MNPRTPSIYKPDQNTDGVTPQDIISNAIENRHIGAGEITNTKLANEVLVLLEKVANTITVATDGGNFETLSTAMASITDASITNPYIIKISPGVYTEANPITCKSFVYIRGEGIVIIKPLTVSQNVFNLERSAFIDRITIQGATSGTAIYKNSIGNSVITNITFIDCEKCISFENAAGTLNASNLTVLSITTSLTNAIEVLAGNAFLFNVTYSSVPGTTCSNLFYFSSANSIVTVDVVSSFSAHLVNAFKIDTGANAVVRNISLVGMSVGFYIDGLASVRILTAVIFNAQSYGIHITSTAGASLIGLYSCEVRESAILDLLIDCPDCTVFGSGLTTDSSKMQINPLATMHLSFIDLFAGDEGLAILGELHIGSSVDPTESAFGEGDSHVNMFVYTETSGSVFTNVTTAAKSVAGSTFTFPGVEVDNAIYVCNNLDDGTNSLIHHGIKYITSGVAVIGAGEIALEYWNGSSWIEFNGMVTDGDVPFLPYAKQYFEGIGGFQLRYNPLMVNDNWVANDPMSLGDDYFWIRIRIKTEISIAPTFEQFKIHSSRSEKNGDGYDEFFGNSRNWLQLPVNVGSAKPVEGAMQNQTIYTDENVGVGYQVNKFTATSDIWGFGFTIPNNIDTSAPILFRFVGLFSASHTPEFTVRWAKDLPDGTIYTTEPGAASNPSTQLDTVDKAVILNTQEWFEIYLDVSTFIARRDSDFPDFLTITLQPTTLSGTFSIRDVQIYYLGWGVGGHVD